MRGRSLVLGLIGLLAAAAVAWRLRPSAAPAGVGADAPAGEASREPSAAPGLKANPRAASRKGPQGALLPADAQPRPFSRGPLQVRVTVEDEPRAGVTVRLRAADDLQPSSTVKTDASGIARFGAVDRAKVVAEAFADGFRPASTEAQGFEEDEEGVVTLVLEPGIRVAGSVVDSVTGEPLRDASVVARVSSHAFEIGPSDEAGRFVLPGLAEGAVAEIVARLTGRVPAKASVTVKDGLALPPAPVLRLGAATALVGVVRSSDGAPLAGAEVTVGVRTRVPTPDPEKTRDGRPYADSMDRFQWGDDAEPMVPAEDEGLRATSREKGAFRVEGLAFGETYDVWLRHPESVTARQVLEVRAPSSGDAGPVTLVARRPAIVRLAVNTSPDRVVMSGARIRLFFGPYSSAPDESPERGRYHFLDVVPGPVVASVGAPGFRPDVVRGTAAEGATLDLALTLQAKEMIVGVVLDESGRPLQRALVEIGSPDPPLFSPSGIARMASEVTDEDGRFEFWDPPEGATALVAHWSTHTVVLRTRRPLPVQPSTSEVRVVLSRRGSLHIRLVTPEGVEFDGPAWAELDAVKWNRRRIHSEQGRLTRADIADGEYALLIVAPGWAWMRRVVTIRDGTGGDLGDVVLDPGTAIVGRVLDDAGHPVKEAHVLPAFIAEESIYTMFPSRFPSRDRSAWTDAEGRFRLEHVPRGEDVELRVTATGYTEVSIHGVGGAAAPVEARLGRKARLFGEVRGPEAVDVRNALIQLRPAGARVVRFDDHEYVEGAEAVDVDDEGRFSAWLPPGNWTAVWIDGEKATHPIGEWTLTAGAECEVVLRIPGR